MKVSAVMTHDVQVCLPTEPLTRAAQIMWEQDCGCVPVLSAEGHPIGMITDRDVCMAAYTQGSRLDEVPVERAMSKTVYSCRATDDLATSQETMRKHRVRRLPVIDDKGKLVGLLSLADAFRTAAGQTASIERGKWAQQLTDTMGEITQTHCEVPTTPATTGTTPGRTTSKQAAVGGSAT